MRNYHYPTLHQKLSELEDDKNMGQVAEETKQPLSYSLLSKSTKRGWNMKQVVDISKVCMV